MVDTSQKPEFKREILPAGSYVGTLYSIVDLGTQRGEYQGEPTENRKIRLSREMPSEMRVFKEENGEQPMAIHKEYTLSFHEKSNLRKDLKSWRGRDIEENEQFDMSTLIGTNCLLSIGIKDWQKSQYNVINAISAPVKWSIAQEIINKPVIWVLDDGMNEVYNSFPQFLKDKISACVEWTDPKPETASDDSDLPF